ncbi:dTMP kinase, partial [Azospirillum isscasi]
RHTGAPTLPHQLSVAPMCQCLSAAVSLEIFAETGIPQRCELVDVAHASLSGASGIMLGKETVFSRHPLEAIRLGAGLGQVSSLPSSSWLSYARKGGRRDSSRRLIAIEGPNGAGKSTVCSRVTERLGAVSMRGVPALWEEVSLKTRVLSSKHWQAALLHYLAGTIELQSDLPAEDDVVIDRCVWSTLAVHAALEPSRIRTVLRALDMFAAEIPFPDLTIYLDADPAACQARIANKTSLERQWDEVGPTGVQAHQRERDLFAWLAQAGVPVVFIPANETSDTITERILEILEP